MKKNSSSHTTVAEESMIAWSKLIEKMEHDIINKIALLRLRNRDLQKILPILFKTYEIALEHKLVDTEIEPRLIDFYHNQNHANLDDLIEHMVAIYDAVHSFIRELSNRTHLSAKESVERVLNSYEFKNAQRQCIEFDDKNNFSFSFPELFIQSALVDCLNFAFLHALDESNPVKIKIYFSKKNQGNAIHFKVNSPEIRENHKRFLTNSLVVKGTEITPGMNFCQLALIHIGGHVTCEITPGKEVEFIVFFQKQVD